MQKINATEASAFIVPQNPLIQGDEKTRVNKPYTRMDSAFQHHLCDHVQR
jgi:hypothetical protein